MILVVHKNWQWNGGIVGVNSFGFGGANAHIILKSNPKPKVPATPDPLPRLVPISGRSEEAVNAIFDKRATKSLRNAEKLRGIFQPIDKCSKDLY
ncbi:hypothetical protein LSTR_LSTR017159 [Laodelphax striatellus]|uniref:Polyketide synthase C-terminal extension domain-containing protein n=1 Tax=Laodelphax striatellus TaxID=195883 RepID=A0A482XGZ5_LAOST|nr:hypothetical protein LSTR_LSTR017159 [Laodelphax striatellus]